MKQKKVYTLLLSRMHFGSRPTDKSEVKGTLEELTDYFSYTLQVGNSYNRRIPLQPKTIRSLESAINKSYEYKNSGMSWVELQKEKI